MGKGNNKAQELLKKLANPKQQAARQEETKALSGRQKAQFRQYEDGLRRLAAGTKGLDPTLVIQQSIRVLSAELGCSVRGIPQLVMQNDGTFAVAVNRLAIVKKAPEAQ